MSGRLPGACATLLLVVATLPLQAHHSFVAAFDRNQPIRLTDTVTTIEWRNPHVSLYVDVTEPETGRVASWALEMSAPSVVARGGWRRSTIKVGDLVVVEGFRAINGSNFGRALTVTLVRTGERLSAGQHQRRGPRLVVVTGPDDAAASRALQTTIDRARSSGAVRSSRPSA